MLLAGFGAGPFHSPLISVQWKAAWVKSRCERKASSADSGMTLKEISNAGKALT
jgi:hypothetical protein